MKHIKCSFFSLLLIGFCALSLITACKKDNQTEQEFITKIVVHLSGAGFDKEFVWQDRDGDGGVAPLIDTISIPANVQLSASLHVYDESQTPVNNVTEEIMAENTVHLFVYKNSVAGLTISDLNTDNDGKPFGLESKWTTTTASSGLVEILLHHEPIDKTAAEPGGEIDFDVAFPVKVK